MIKLRNIGAAALLMMGVLSCASVAVKAANQPAQQRQLSLADLERHAQYVQNMRLQLLHDRFAPLATFSTAKQIIHDNERKELQLNWLVKSIDNCRTILGSWALQKHLEQPIADVKTLQERQELIALFAYDTPLLEAIDQYMGLLRYTQTELIDHMTQMDQNTLQKDTKSLYYSVPWGIGDYLNQKRLALDGCMLYELGRSTSYFLGLLGFEGIKMGLYQMAVEDNANFEPLNWLANGLKEPFNDLNFWEAKETAEWDKPKNGVVQPISWAKYLKAVNQGTLYDRCYAFTHGAERKINIDLPAPEFVKKGFKWFFEGQSRPITTAAAIPLGITVSAVHYYIYYMSIRSAYNHLSSTHEKMENAHKFMVHVAQFIRVMQKLAKQLIRHTHISKTFLGQSLIELFNPATYSQELKELFELLNTPTFDLSSEQTLLYSRGRVLLAYNLLDKVMAELLPMMRAVGMIDMYSSLALRMNDTEHPWKFVEFVESAEPVFVLNEYNTPVYSHAVANSIAFGDGNPTKMLITGPNMGGKSAVLRLMLGHSSVLAQSIGMVPAQSMKMTVFSELLTSIDPHEDMARGISKFMAVNMSMRRLYQEIERFDAHNHYLILIDEPFDGTVDEETARRTGELLEWSTTNKKQVVITIATHILPQIKPEKQSLFSYKHVEILEPTPGNFVRTHKLKTGIDEAWFHDHARRRRYIDWLGNHRIVGHMPPQAPEVATAMAQA